MDKEIIENIQRVLDWAHENPEAITALLEGKAAVVPFVENKVINWGGVLQYIRYENNETHEGAMLNVGQVRLDKPKEAV